MYPGVGPDPLFSHHFLRLKWENGLPFAIYHSKTQQISLENKLLIISMNFIPKTSHSCQKLCFPCPWCCNHQSVFDCDACSLEAICIAGPSDNSAMLEGEATLGLEVCTNQSATTTKAEQTGLKTAFKGQLRLKGKGLKTDL